MNISISRISTLLFVPIVALGCLAAPGFSQGGGPFHDNTRLLFRETFEGFSSRLCISKEMSQEPIGKPALSITRIIDESIESIRKQKPEKKRDPKPRATLEGMALSENGEPARDIEIHLLGLDSPSNYWGCTDARGRYSVNALPGNYVACVLYRGGIGLCRDFALRKERKTQSDLHLAFFTRVEPGDLLRRLPTGSGGSIFSSIEGAVFHGQAPVPGINVEIRPLGKTPAEPLATITFLQGRYSLTAPPGEYTVCVVYRGASRLCRIASLRQGRRIVSDFNLEDLDE